MIVEGGVGVDTSVLLSLLSRCKKGVRRRSFESLFKEVSLGRSSATGMMHEQHEYTSWWTATGGGWINQNLNDQNEVNQVNSNFNLSGFSTLPAQGQPTTTTRGTSQSTSSTPSGRADVHDSRGPQIERSRRASEDSSRIASGSFDSVPCASGCAFHGTSGISFDVSSRQFPSWQRRQMRKSGGEISTLR